MGETDRDKESVETAEASKTELGGSSRKAVECALVGEVAARRVLASSPRGAVRARGVAAVELRLTLAEIDAD